MALEFSIPHPKKKITKLEDIVADNIDEYLGSSTPKGKFKLHCKRVMITYKTFVDKDAITQFFIADGAKIVRIAHEIGDKSHNYEHSHVFVDFGKQICRTNCRMWDFNGIHPQIKPINGRAHLGNIYKYMCKYDHSNDDMLEWKPEEDGEVKILWEHPNLQSAIKDLKLNQVPGAIAAFNLKPKDKLTFDPWTFKWQSDCELHMTSHSAPKRKIFWYHDRIGGAGKTNFCLGMYDRYPSDTAILTQFGGQRDTATIIQNEINRGWTGKYCIIDLPRDAQTKAIYEPLECIINGCITSIKYSGCTLRWNPGWLIVLANFPPEFGHMSPDRWVVAHMTDDKYYSTLMDGTQFVPPPLSKTMPVVVPIDTGIDAWEPEYRLVPRMPNPPNKTEEELVNDRANGVKRAPFMSLDSKMRILSGLDPNPLLATDDVIRKSIEDDLRRHDTTYSKTGHSPFYK
nr:MAG: replication associated protein [Cressdnaviricota sp.]